MHEITPERTVLRGVRLLTRNMIKSDVFSWFMKKNYKAYETQRKNKLIIV